MFKSFISIPDYSLENLKRSVAYGHLNKLDVSLADAEEVVKLHDDWGCSHYLKGWVLNLRGEKKQAVAEYRKSAELYKASGDEANAKAAQDNADSIEKSIALAVPSATRSSDSGGTASNTIYSSAIRAR